MLMIKASMGSGCQGAELVVKGERLQNMVEAEPKLFLIQGDVYEVEKLVAVKIVKGKKLYRVRWRGYGKESDTLEPEENLFSCKDMIEELELKIKERHEKKKGKKLLKTSTITRELRSIDRIPDEKLVRAATTWQATEIQPSENNMKDTFWRDFDEGKIKSEAVFDKDMYSKVKERAARTSNLMDTGRVGESSAQKENPPLCPKVLLKRKPCVKTNDNLTYKSSLKVKPMSLHVRKRKKYDVLRDYRKRRNRMHRKRNIDENGQRKLLKTMVKHDNYNAEAEQNGSKILQELLINDEKGSVFPDYVLNSSKSESENVSCMSKLNALNSCEEILRVDSRKNQSLVCRISVQDNSMETFPSQNQVRTSTSAQFDHNSRLSVTVTIQNLFHSLLDAIINDKLEKLRRLCHSSQILNCFKEDGTTALMVAAYYGKYYATEILLKAKAHKDKQNRRGETALMLACRNRHPEIVRLLLEYGANFALTNADGYNVLKLSNQCRSRMEISEILFDHIVRVVSEFEEESKSLIGPIGCIKYALFPIQRFSLNEGPVLSINFQHNVKLESHEKRGYQNLLFIAHCTIDADKVKCEFDVDSLVNNVTINGVKQELFEDVDSLFKVTGLQTGSNKVKITTVYSPQSEVKLIVCAYKVYRTVCFPAQKLKGDF